MSTPPEPRPGDRASTAGSALCAVLGQLRTNKKLSYETLGLSRGTALNYITKPGPRCDTRTLGLLLTALGASAQDRALVLQLHHQTQPEPVDAAQVGWTVRARAAGCVVWPMAEFTAVRATVHTAIGRRQHSVPDRGPVGDRTLPAYVPRAHDPALRRDLEQAATGHLRALIVVRGTSSTGKTRSLFEAVHTLGPGVSGGGGCRADAAGSVVGGGGECPHRSGVNRTLGSPKGAVEYHERLASGHGDRLLEGGGERGE